MTQNEKITEETKRLGIELKLLRVRAGLTQEKLCELSGGELKRNAIINIERCNNNASAMQLIKYASLLGYRLNIEPDPDFTQNNK